MRTASSDCRARLTLVDVVNIGASIAVLVFLAVPLYDVLQQQAGELGAGVELLMQALVPVTLVAVLVVVFTVAVKGGAQ